LSENDFYTPTDLDRLRMENELLAFEVRFLKARLADSARVPGLPAAGSTSMSRLVHLEEAENDLVLLVRRLGASPLGPVLRRSANFRTLEERYVRPPADRVMSASERASYLEGAERDLVLLLRRLGRPPLGTVFRRRPSFRTLEQRYL
jgi:hypothetical protein